MPDKHHHYQHHGRAERDRTAESDTFKRDISEDDPPEHSTPPPHPPRQKHYWSCTFLYLGVWQRLLFTPFISSYSLFCSSTAFHFATTYMRHPMPSAEWTNQRTRHYTVALLKHISLCLADSDTHLREIPADKCIQVSLSKAALSIHTN